MTALTADRDTPIQGLSRNRYPVAASTTIYAGGAVAIGSDGYAKPAADTAGLKFVGIAQDKVDNSAGSDGDKSVDVQCPDGARWVASGISVAHVGTDVYFADDQTVNKTATNCYAGKIAYRYSATDVVVDHRAAYAEKCA